MYYFRFAVDSPPKLLPIRVVMVRVADRTRCVRQERRVFLNAELVTRSAGQRARRGKPPLPDESTQMPWSRRLKLDDISLH